MQERQIQLLEAIASSSKPVNVQELVSITGFPRATIYRNVAALAECGFVDEVSPGNRYVIGLRLVTIALTGKSDATIINNVAPMMHKIVRTLGETAFFARYRGGRVDLIEVLTPRDPSVSYIYPGMGQRPPHACSSAKVIAAFIHPDLRAGLLEKNPLRYNARTLVEPQDIQRELETVRKNSYAICDGEMEDGVTSVAVPIIIDRLGGVFSIGVVGPTSRTKNVIEHRLLPVLREEAVRAAAAIQHCTIAFTQEPGEETTAVLETARPH